MFLKSLKGYVAVSPVSLQNLLKKQARACFFQSNPRASTHVQNHVGKPYLRNFLVGDFKSAEKYARQNGSSFQIGLQMKDIWNHPVLGDIEVLMVQKSGVHLLRLVAYPIIYKVLYILGGCLGFLPSTVLSLKREQEKRTLHKRLSLLHKANYVVHLCRPERHFSSPPGEKSYPSTHQPSPQSAENNAATSLLATYWLGNRFGTQNLSRVQSLHWW